MRESNDQYQGTRLMNGFDYEHQAWVKDGKYVACGHQDDCGCYGKLHAGEETKAAAPFGWNLIDTSHD